MNETKNASKSRTVISGSLLFLSLAILTINFQNCSGLSSSNYGDNDAVTDREGSVVDDILPITPTTPTPNDETGLTAIFSVGDSFNGQDLVSSGSFVDSMVERVGYVTYGSGKAIAVASSGLGYVALTGGTNLEAERMAVESCNLLATDSCALIISGNSFVIDSTDVLNNMEYKLDGLKGKAFSASEIPMASTAKRDTAMVRNFMNAPGNKALAVSITGALYAAYTTTHTLSESDVSRMAVQRCELESAITPCVLYALNTRVEFNPRGWMKKGSINYSNNDVLALPPPASRATALTSITTLLDEVGQKKYAIYATPNGYGYFGRHDNDNAEAEKLAKGYCEAGVHGSRCILYASTRGVHINPEDSKAKMNFNGLYCKSPRYSCADHRAAGCTENGDYWVQDSSSLKSVVMTCN
jgi:hypothetical protein